MKRIAFRTLALGFLWSLAACGPAQIPNPAASPEGAFDPSHARFESILQAHVSQGLVDYAALSANRQPLDAYLASVASVDQTTFEQWPEADQLAFLINAYNAYTLQLVAEHWPVESIKDTHVTGNPWDHFEFPLLGGNVTLNDIEHRLIRPVYEEPRIHFALVCAAISCPPLLPRPHRGEDLDQMLERVTREFLTGPMNDLSDPDHLVVSALFDWYREDFVASAGSVPAFITAHVGQPISPQAEVDFAPYDWAINAQ